jgi:hypothetical protein
MSTRSTQAVIAVLRMSGVQDVQVDSSHPHTDDAAVVVRVGKSLLYLHELRTAEHLAEPWTEAAKLIKSLPMFSARDAVKPIEGMPDPAVISTHSHADTRQGLVQQKILADNGVDLGNVLIGHAGDSADLDYLTRLADAGSWLGMVSHDTNVVSDNVPDALRRSPERAG